MESTEADDCDEFVDSCNIPYPTQQSREYVPLDRIIGCNESTQRNIFGTHFETCIDLSTYERDHIEQFNKRLLLDSEILLDIDYEETQHLRFLQGCGWNIELAHNSLKEFVDWKKTHDFDNFNPNSSHPIIYWHGKDMCARPILIVRCKDIPTLSENSQTIGRCLSRLIIDHMGFFVNELTVPDHVEQLVVIVDLEEFALWGTPFGDIQELIQKLSAYFRSRLNKVFLINTPLLFYGIWSAIKIFIPQKTLAKVHILGADYVSTLLQFINIDELCPLISGGIHE